MPVFFVQITHAVLEAPVPVEKARYAKAGFGDNSCDDERKDYFLHAISNSV
jgi:hypothetical protein